MLQWIVLLPVAFPVVFAALSYPLSPRLAQESKHRLILSFIPIEIMLLVLCALPFEHRLVISNWAAATFEIALVLDGIAFWLLLILYLLMGALWLIIPSSARLDLTTGLVLSSASALVLSTNVPTIYLAWVLYDAATFAWRLVHDVDRGDALRSLIMSQIGALLLLAGAQLIGTNAADKGALLIGLAFWARLGILPFHSIYPLRGLDSRDLWFARAVPLFAGASLWLRWSQFRVQPPGQILAILGLVAIIASAIWMWKEEQPARAAVHGVWHAVPFIPLAVAYGVDSGSTLAFWTIIGLVFSVAFFEIGLRWRARNQNYWIRIFWTLGILSLAGVPITPAFAGRMGLYSYLIESGNAWLLLVFLIVVTLILSILLRFGAALDGAEPRSMSSREWSGVVLVLVLFIVCTLLAYPWALFVGAPVSDAVQAFVAFSTENAIFLIVAFLTLLIPPALAYMGQKAGRTIASHPGRPITVLAATFELSWLERLATGIGYQISVTVRSLATIAEENPTVWIILVALWIAILTVLPR